MSRSVSRYLSLDPNEIIGTVDRLSRRVGERFPGAGLGALCDRLLSIARRARERSIWIGQPIWPIRVSTWALVALIVAGLLTTVLRFRMPPEGFRLGEFIQVLEAGINDVVLIGAAVFFLATLETRIKRRRALDALHELRAVAHIIDMHQLTKDPERLGRVVADTASSPARPLTGGELGRYLDYCSEMLSLTGKIGALYVQQFPDSVAIAAVNEIEDLTSGLSRKIWQKLVILHGMDVEGAGP